MATEIFIKTQQKFIRGIYFELDLLTDKEKKQPLFKITNQQKRELLGECKNYMDFVSKRKFDDYLNSMTKENGNKENPLLLMEGLSYLHHHFLDGNSLFTYSINQCSKKWTIQYLEKKQKFFKVPIDPEFIFLGFLTFLVKKDRKGRYQVPTYTSEYYLFILELIGYIKRENQKIYLTSKAYHEGQKILKQGSLTEK